jgi:hypothetical protein
MTSKIPDPADPPDPGIDRREEPRRQLIENLAVLVVRRHRRQRRAARPQARDSDPGDDLLPTG